MLKKIIIAALSIFILISCSQKKVTENTDAWTEITPETETTIEVWGWNLAAEHMKETIASFNKKYPKIKVNVTKFGGPAVLKQKLYVAFGANENLPNLVQMEDCDIALITEQYHKFFLDLKDQIIGVMK